MSKHVFFFTWVALVFCQNSAWAQTDPLDYNAMYPHFVSTDDQNVDQGSVEEVIQTQSSLPTTNSTSHNYYKNYSAPLTIAQQRAHFDAEQRMYQAQWYNWIGYSPLRPTINADYMSYTSSRYYLPSRGIIVRSGYTRGWYW